MAAIFRFDFDVSKMTRQGGCCTTVVVQNEIQIHQQNGERPIFPYRILCHPAVLRNRKLATCFL